MSRQKRRFSDEFKLEVVQAVVAGESQAAVARRHAVSANTILEWMKAYRTGRLGGEVPGGADVQRLLIQARADEAHIAELQRLVGQKEEEISFLKKNGTPEGVAERRRCVAEERGPLPVEVGCALMGLPRSTFYYRSPVQEGCLRQALDLQDRIEQIAFHHLGYGYRRITAELHRKGVVVNHKTVLKVMRESDLLVRPLRGFLITTDSKHAFPVYPNLYQNRWPSAPNEIWAADITYIRLPLGFCYLAVILDLYARRVIGWAVEKHLEARLAAAALQMALRKRKPPTGLIHHSDRGVQYACTEYTDLLKQHGFRISMSRKGNPYDNAAMESFMKTLKTEEVYINEYRTLEEARHKIAHFLNHVDNQTRLHSRLGYLPPDEYELQYKQPLPAA